MFFLALEYCSTHNLQGRINSSELSRNLLFNPVIIYDNINRDIFVYLMTNYMCRS